jgi:glycerol kinase
VAQHLILAVDNGTTSTRAIVFDERAMIVSRAQLETTQSFPGPGWVEQDARELWKNTETVVREAVAALAPATIDALGVTTQRETTIAWDHTTGEPLAPAIVWQDTRTQDWLDDTFTPDQRARITHLTGLPVTAYFSASKMRWLLDNCEAVALAARAGTLAFGTPDSWLTWNLSGGVASGIHVTDVTNASRTMLMDLETLSWSEELCTLFGINPAWLPRIVPSISDVGTGVGVVDGVPIRCIFGDQQAASFGQRAVNPGDTKNTYGTGNFLMTNTGTEIVRSRHGLITTVACQHAGSPATYALEGSVAVSGSLIQWLRDNLEVIAESAEIEALASSVSDNGGVYFVPAFSGLFAPYWRPDARGAIVGLTRFATKAHIARAALEATAFQSWDVIDATNNDTGRPLKELRVDGGMVVNELLMQFQADILGIPVVHPATLETTALGAAYGAGLASHVWRNSDDLAAHWREARRWIPQISPEERSLLLDSWHKAVTKSLDWVD